MSLLDRERERRHRRAVRFGVRSSSLDPEMTAWLDARSRNAILMRSLGMTWEAIGAALPDALGALGGVSEARARQIVRRATGREERRAKGRELIGS